MVIEVLTITCPPGRRDEFIARDAEAWTPALAKHPGFIGKEVWACLDDPCRVVLVIRWESLAQWKTFPPELEARLAAQMGDVQLSLRGEAYEVAL